jgi:hypothetical protein
MFLHFLYSSSSYANREYYMHLIYVLFFYSHLVIGTVNLNHFQY